MDALSGLAARCRESLGQLVQLARERMIESWRLRLAVFALLSACAAVAFFVYPIEADGVKPRELADEKLSALQEEKPRGSYQEIAGSKAALSKEGLGNPFLPAHPKQGDVQLSMDANAKGTELLDAKKAGKGKAGKLAAHTANMLNLPNIQNGNAQAASANGKSNAGVQAAKPSAKLLGVMQADGNQAALIFIDGESKLLAVGERHKEYYLEAITADGAQLQAAGSSYCVQVGEDLPLG